MRDGVITAPVRIFAPGFGAGAVAGYTVLRLDPAVVAVQLPHPPAAAPADAVQAPATGQSLASDEVQAAFG